jgi:hypothetical protein
MKPAAPPMAVAADEKTIRFSKTSRVAPRLTAGCSSSVSDETCRPAYGGGGG